MNPPFMTERARQEMLMRIAPQLRALVLVGGQAVDVWSEAYASRLPGVADGFRIASKDVDFATSSPERGVAGDIRSVIRTIGARLDGDVRFATLDDHTVSFGRVDFTDADGHRRAIDFLGAPFGLDARAVSKSCVPLRLGSPELGVELYVIHPVYSMISRTHNVVGLPGQYHTPRGLEQLRASILCAGAFLAARLDVGDDKAVRDVLRWNERIAEFCAEDPNGRRVVGLTGLDPFDAVVVDPRLGELFLTRRLPAMRARVVARRR